jgi:NAD-dependent SIR2 family protein deacetylase|tara:strand:- start:954 stop:1313 length:360 start_codon:yes stop_codon:yes gene_type:complete
MGNKYAAGKFAIAICDRCGFRFKLKQLRQLTIKTKKVNILVCPDCFEKDHPQLQVGMKPINDPQALKNPRPDTTMFSESKSRNFQYGFNPVGLADPYKIGYPNVLIIKSKLGNVTVTID